MLTAVVGTRDHKHVPKHVHICVYEHVHKHVHIFVHKHVHQHVHICVHKHVHKHVHKYVHKCVHKHVHKRIRKCVQTRGTTKVYAYKTGKQETLKTKESQENEYCEGKKNRMRAQRSAKTVIQVLQNTP